MWQIVSNPIKQNIVEKEFYRQLTKISRIKFHLCRSFIKKSILLIRWNVVRTSSITGTSSGLSDWAFKAEPGLSQYECRNSDPGRCLRCRLPRTDERTLIEHPSGILLRSWYVTWRYILAMRFLPERKSDQCLGIARFTGRLITSFIMQIRKMTFIPNIFQRTFSYPCVILLLLAQIVSTANLSFLYIYFSNRI